MHFCRDGKCARSLRPLASSQYRCRPFGGFREARQVIGRAAHEWGVRDAGVDAVPVVLEREWQFLGVVNGAGAVAGHRSFAGGWRLWGNRAGWR